MSRWAETWMPWLDSAFGWLATHALVAAGLAVTVALVASRVRHAAAVHALWVVVLLKLLTPPFVALAVLPAPAPDAAAPAAHFDATMEPSALLPPASVLAAESVHGGASNLWMASVLAVLAGGSLALAVLAVVRHRRFRRRLRGPVAPPDELRRRVDELSRRLGLSRPPRVRAVTARVSPMLWPCAGGAELILPEGLLHRLSGAELDAVVAHELAHLKRRDHWVRLLELAAMVLFWWHPAVWWARHRLRQVEELSCDAWVARALPGRARDYAEGLLKTLEFLAGAERPLPAAGTGIGRARTDMKERLTMILTERTPRPLSAWHRLAIAAAAAAVLAVLPTRADRAEEGVEEPSAEQTWLREQTLDLERREVELQRQLHELEVERRDLDRRRESLERKAELARLERTAQELEASGKSAEAELNRQRQAELERESELADQRYEVERRLLEERIPAELELREQGLRIEELELAGKHEEAEALRAEAQARKERLAASAMELQKRQLEIERAQAESRRESLESLRQALLEAGSEEEAARLAEEMARLEAETRMTKQHYRLQMDQLDHERWQRDASAKLRALEADRQEATEKMRREIEARTRAWELEQREKDLDLREMKQSLARAELGARLEVLEKARAEEPSAERRERLAGEIERLKQQLAELSGDRVMQ